MNNERIRFVSFVLLLKGGFDNLSIQPIQQPIKVLDKSTRRLLFQYSFLGYQAQFKTIQTDWKEDKIIITQQNFAVSNVKLGDEAVTSDRISIKMARDIQYDA